MFEIAAHRGGNSWSGIYEAIKKGYDYIELDVHLSSDKYLIVQYSPKVQIDGENIYIQNLQYDKLSIENKNKLLLLSDVLLYAKGRIGVVIDIKRGYDFYENIGRRIADLVKILDVYRYTWLISFDHCCLWETKQYEPKIKVAPMYVARLYDEERYWENLHSDGIEICNDYLEQNTVVCAHARNLKVLGWCTTDVEELKRLVSLKLDIITIEQEDFYLNYLKELKENKGWENGW